MTNQTICKICSKSVINLGMHVLMAHKIEAKEYYDTFLKKPTEGVCIICTSNTRYVNTKVGYKKYCSNLCSSKDKDLQKIKTQSYMTTLANNPDIKVRRNKKVSNTWKTNPSITIQRIEKFKQTLADNPTIMIDRDRKRKIQEHLNPQINIDRGNSISISLRNFYNDRRKPSSPLVYYLYLVQHQERSIVKIGITHNLKKRLYEIKRVFGSSKCLHTIEGSYNLIAKLETQLHNHFNNYCEVQPTGEGRTEWFNSSITNEVINLMTLDHFSLDM